MDTKNPNHPLIVGITGASGVIYGVRALEVLRELAVPTHLIMSPAAEVNLAIETSHTPDQVRDLATVAHGPREMTAGPASGSFPTRGMLIAPCTIKTLSAVANSYTDSLMVRAADVQLKERRPLVLMVRETPLHAGHLDLMQKCARLGAHILPPVPAFYHQPKSIADIIDQSIGKALDLLGIENQLFQRWE